MNGPTEEDNWELSKENIQPIKQGRKASVLSSTFDETYQKELASKRQNFEMELRTYSGPDPLEVWYNYALWIEQNYPKGGKDLSTLIKSCFTMIQQSPDLQEKYKHDERLLELWVKYINMCPAALEVYQTLHSKDFFTKLASFFTYWAWEMEKTGNFKRTDAIYIEGINRKASPIENLENAHKLFQARVAQKIIYGEDEIQNEDPQRIAFSALKSKKGHAPTERVQAIAGSAGHIKVAPSTKRNVLGPGFQIFQDENGGSESVQGGVSVDNSTAGPTISSFSAKENNRCASVWTKNKVKQKTTSTVPVEELSQICKPKFSVHEDMDKGPDHQSNPNNHKFSSVLSARKNDEEWNVPMFIVEPFNANVQPQYCKNKVYCGTEEFSFEELRAAKILKQEAEERKKQEKEALKDEMEQMKERLKRNEEILAQQNKLIQTLVQKKTSVPVVTARDDESMINYSVVNKSASFAANNTQNISHLLSFHRPLQMNTTEKEIASISEHPAFNETESAPSSAHTSSSIPRSPTVNTKLVNNLIGGLFNGTLCSESNKSSTLSDQIFCGKNVLPPPPPLPTAVPFEIFSDEVKSPPPPPPAAPFKIFSDENDIKSPPPPAALAPFKIFSDENEDIVAPPIPRAATFDIFSDVKSPPPPTAAAFKIFSDENTDVKSPSPPPPAAAFKIFSDENDIKSPPPPAAAFNIFTDKDEFIAPPPPSAPVTDVRAQQEQSHPPQFDDENDENAPPSNVILPKDKRRPLGILKESKDIPFCPLEEQEAAIMNKKGNCKMEQEKCDMEEEKDLQGIEPFMDDMTLPANVFSSKAFVASTPGPWSMGFVPQVENDDDDFTVAIPFKKCKQEEYDKLEKELSVEKEHSAELMPPPPSNLIATPNQIATANLIATPSQVATPNQVVNPNQVANPQTSICLASTTNFQLSPIMEASREYVSSSSSSSSCNTLGSQSTFSHMTHTALSVKNNSRSRGLSTFPRNDDNFDPSKVAMMLFNMDADDQIPEFLATHEAPATQPKNWPIESTKLDLPVDLNPFCAELQKQLLDSLKEPVSSRGGFVSMEGIKFPVVKPNLQLNLGSEIFRVKKMKGTGAYAQVFHASTIDPMNVTLMPDAPDDDDEAQMVLKVQKPSCFWEFYICHELRQRLKKKGFKSNILDSVMRINRGYFFNQGSILVSDYHKRGTILDLVNAYKIAGKSVPITITMYLLIQIMETLRAMHSCHIIHGDVKPDNIMIVDVCSANLVPGQVIDKPFVVKFIDMGRAIDMDLFPQNTKFHTKVTTDGFTCCEMKENRPWTYQTDLFGLAATAHILLWGTYMNVHKESTWKLQGVRFQRNWNSVFWLKFFNDLLNVPSCSQLPDLEQMRNDMQRQLDSSSKAFTSDIRAFANLVAQIKL